jgi:hypothetical protein
MIGGPGKNRRANQADFDDGEDSFNDLVFR